LIENGNVIALSLASDKPGTCKLALTLFYASATIPKILAAWLH